MFSSMVPADGATQLGLLTATAAGAAGAYGAYRAHRQRQEERKKEYAERRKLREAEIERDNARRAFHQGWGWPQRKGKRQRGAGGVFSSMVPEGDGGLMTATAITAGAAAGAAGAYGAYRAHRQREEKKKMREEKQALDQVRSRQERLRIPVHAPRKRADEYEKGRAESYDSELQDVVPSFDAVDGDNSSEMWSPGMMSPGMMSPNVSPISSRTPAAVYAPSTSGLVYGQQLQFDDSRNLHQDADSVSWGN